MATANPHEAAPKQRIHMQTALDVRENVLETHDLAARHRRRIEHCHGRDLDVIVLRLHVEELRILWAELVH